MLIGTRTEIGLVLLCVSIMMSLLPDCVLFSSCVLEFVVFYQWTTDDVLLIIANGKGQGAFEISVKWLLVEINGRIKGSTNLLPQIQGSFTQVMSHRVDDNLPSSWALPSHQQTSWLLVVPSPKALGRSAHAGKTIENDLIGYKTRV